MSFDVVCTGPVFLDLTFEGLDALPAPGRERFAVELHETPGGAAITAIGLARLGLRVAVAAPLAAAIQQRRQLNGKRIALIASGGNASREQILDVLRSEDAPAGAASRRQDPDTVPASPS